MKPFRITLTLCCLSAPPAALAAQEPWSAPNTIRWPLLELAVVQTPSGPELLLAPSTVAEQRRVDPIPLVTLDLDTTRLSAWVDRAHRFADSVVSAPRDLRAPRISLRIPGHPAQPAFRLGYDANAPPIPGRFFLTLQDSLHKVVWTAYGPDSAATAFLEALAAPGAPPATRAEPPQAAEDLESRCGALEPARPLSAPKLRFLPGRGTGGLVVLEYVIDTTGRPQAAPVAVLLSTGPRYTEEVRRIFPELRFTPALCDGTPVAFLARQSFRFRRP